MIKVQIKKNGVVTHQGLFETNQEANAWLDAEEQKQSFGSIDPKEYEVVITDITAQVLQDGINKQALAYLDSTDWYVIRKTETGVDVPAEILQLRAEARERIVK